MADGDGKTIELVRFSKVLLAHFYDFSVAKKLNIARYLFISKKRKSDNAYVGRRYQNYFKINRFFFS